MTSRHRLELRLTAVADNYDELFAQLLDIEDMLQARQLLEFGEQFSRASERTDGEYDLAVTCHPAPDAAWPPGHPNYDEEQHT